MLGSMIGGILCKKLGRKIPACIGCSVMILGVIVMCFSRIIWLVMIFRLILGSGIGILTVVCPLYVSEMSPGDRRGKFGTIFQLSITVGIFLSYLIGWGVRNIDIPIHYQWRLMMSVGGLFPLVLMIGAITKMVEPRKNTTWIETSKLVLKEDDRKSVLVTDLCRMSELRLLLVTSLVLAGSMQLTGITTVLYYGPLIIQKAGVTHPFLINIAIGFWNFVTTAIAFFLVERVGRRKLMLCGLTLMSLSLMEIGFIFNLALENKISQTNESIAIGIGLCFFIIGFEGGPGCLFWVIANELFPEEYTEISATYANAFQWAFNLAISTLFPIMAEQGHLNPSGTFYLIGGITTCITIYLSFFLPETKRQVRLSMIQV
eukprot:TRINITY_DN6828_c0_g2_i1.p1 TRINITY_DN6828_c0_g2~~TRINITY_DN6828_c0_g2_i1.p1  ORF type:complete len:374 (-),score=46.68 TRINITY_DN6828_c0_g2_i1:127-1248(-)